MAAAAATLGFGFGADLLGTYLKGRMMLQNQEDMMDFKRGMLNGSGLPDQLSSIMAVDGSSMISQQYQGGMLQQMSSAVMLSTGARAAGILPWLTGGPLGTPALNTGPNYDTTTQSTSGKPATYGFATDREFIRQRADSVASSSSSTSTVLGTASTPPMAIPSMGGMNVISGGSMSSIATPSASAVNTGWSTGISTATPLGSPGAIIPEIGGLNRVPDNSRASSPPPGSMAVQADVHVDAEPSAAPSTSEATGLASAIG